MEVVGYISVFSFLLLLMIFQYSLMAVGLYKKDLNTIENIIGWIPLLPFILMGGLTIWYVSGYFLKKINKWFELNWGWLFVNGRKREAWAEYLRKKYKD